MKPSVYVFFGLIATGKSTLAKFWAERYGLAAFNSDVIRKELAGLPPTARLTEAPDRGIYSREFSVKTYAALRSRAEAEMQAGRGVVLDASFHRREERVRIRALARLHGFPVYFILCTSPEAVLRERLARRALDQAAVSDGRWEIYLQQKQKFESPTELAPDELVTLDTVGPVAAVADRLAATLPDLEIKPPTRRG